MSTKMKYIVFEKIVINGRMFNDRAFVFPNDIEHGDMARTLMGTFFDKDLIHSAGFCSLEPITQFPRNKDAPPANTDVKDKALGVRWMCWGESVSLKKEVDAERDQRLLDKQYR